MKKQEQREVSVCYCDFCGKEAQHLNRCAICKKEMCNEGGGGKHASFSIELYRYSDGHRLIGHICAICAERKINLSIQELLNRMMGDDPVPLRYL